MFTDRTSLIYKNNSVPQKSTNVSPFFLNFEFNVSPVYTINS